MQMKTKTILGGRLVVRVQREHKKKANGQAGQEQARPAGGTEAHSKAKHGASKQGRATAGGARERNDEEGAGGRWRSDAQGPG